MRKCLGCDKEFNPVDRRQLYHNPKCRYRKYRRKVEAKRREEGNCPKCGGVMDNTGVSYCSRCKEYWQRRYAASKQS